jgi:GH15 family glucan-1,4-alpha-glucosidase
MQHCGRTAADKTPLQAARTRVRLLEGQAIAFVWRETLQSQRNRQGRESRFDRTEGPGQPAPKESGNAADARLSEVSDPAAPVDAACEAQLYDSTLEYWRDWLGACTYRGRWLREVRRSALALKLLTFAPTGGIVAAPTSSLPERMHGSANWDYRYVWIRDASFVMYAFIQLGFVEEARAFVLWIQARCTAACENKKSLQIMYGLRGECELDEIVLEHWSGYQQSRPVRIGNAAYLQKQTDIYGALLDTIYLAVSSLQFVFSP